MHRHVIVAFLPLVLALGCAHEQRVQNSPTPQRGVASGVVDNAPAGRVMGEPTPGEAPEVNGIGQQAVVPVVAASPRPSTERLDDGKILEVARAANAGEIDQARLAEKKASSPAVRTLAHSIATEHEQAQVRTERVAREQNLVASESSTSTKLKEDARRTYTRLAKKSGKDFDRAYVEAQVTQDRAVLDLIDHHLVPDATDASVRALLQEIRPAIAHQASEAQELQDKMGK